MNRKKYNETHKLSWRKINGKKNVPSEVQRKGNTELKAMLEKSGWSMWDAYHIWEEGYSISFRKFFPELQRNYLHFSWQWDDRGFGEFWEADMHGFYNYLGNDKHGGPWAMIEIKVINKTTFELLPKLEVQLLKAINSQSLIELP
jgi:hypothetical protein